jgi:hypothetical protein
MAAVTLAAVSATSIADGIRAALEQRGIERRIEARFTVMLAGQPSDVAIDSLDVDGIRFNMWSSVNLAAAQLDATTPFTALRASF